MSSKESEKVKKPYLSWHPRSCRRRKDDTVGKYALYKRKYPENGTVDHKDAFLDTYDLERSRGITIFSKQAVLSWKDMG